MSDLDGAILINTVQKTNRSFKAFAILIDDNEGKRNDFVNKLQSLAGLEENVKHLDLKELHGLDFYFTEMLCEKLHKKST